MGRSRALDPVLESALTGLEVEAMIKYGGDLRAPVEPAPLASTTHSAGLFCASFPPNPGMILPPDFVREYDRVASTDLDHRTAGVIAVNFRFSKDSSEKYFDTEKAFGGGRLTLGASLAESNPLKAKAFREEDMRWA